MKRVFICYRREDAEAASGELARYLRGRLGPRSVFRDKDDIEGGEKWLNQLDEHISRESVMLVLIGRGWMGRLATREAQRQEDAEDFVRREIRLAMRKEAHLLPILLEDVRMPTDLPEDIRGLAEYQALRLRDDNWENDAQRIVDKLRFWGVGTRRPVFAGGALIAALIIVAAFLGWSVVHRSMVAGCLNQRNNLVKNCGFEDDLAFWGTGYVEDELHPGRLDPFWESWVGDVGSTATRVAQVIGEIDRSVRRSGMNSFAITNNSPLEQHIYGSMSQRVSGLEPHSEYVATFWTKAEGARAGTLEITTDLKWLQRKPIEAGTYDWKPFSRVFNTGDENFVDFRLISEEPGKVWLDDITFKKLAR